LLVSSEGLGHMFSRRRVLITSAATAAAIARVAPVMAEPRRVIVDSQIHLWPANTLVGRLRRF
jgi:hypothetical protein